MKICKIKNCNKKYYGKGYCRFHWVHKDWYPKNRNRLLQYQKQYKLEHYGIGNRMHKCRIKNCNNMVYKKHKYCVPHRKRITGKIKDLDLSKDLRHQIGQFIKGKKNINWKGGIAEYPNHSLMKKNRLIILLHNPICEICNKKPAVEIHHKNGDKSNHRLSNLVASCHRCNTKIRFKSNNSKFRRIYGMNLKEIASKLRYSEGYISFLYKYKKNKFNLLLTKG